MVAVLKDDSGRVIAYAEYNIVDIKGNFTIYGDYCFIFDTWVHEDYRNKGLLKKLLRKERNKHPLVTYIYWTRGKYKNKMSTYEIKELIHGRFKSTSTTAYTSNSTINV